MRHAQRSVTWAANALLYVALLDTAVETFLAGSSIRWIVAAIVIAYAAVTVLTWKRVSPNYKVLASLIALLLLVAYSGWSTGSLEAGGIVLARQSAAVVGAALLIVIFLVAAILLVFVRPMPLWVRACAVVASLYLILPLAAGLTQNSGASAALAGMTAPLAHPFWLRGAYLMAEVALPLLFAACIATAAIAIARRRPGAVPLLLVAVATLIAVQIGAYEAGAQGLPTIVAFEHPQPAQTACNGAMSSIESLAPGGSSLGQMGFGASGGNQSANALGGTAQPSAQATTPCAPPSGAVDAEAAASGAQAKATPGTTATGSAALTNDFSTVIGALQAYDATAPRDSYDPQTVVDQVGHDPVKLFAWVRDNTELIPYRGVLRGPVGVLMDRTGSSLDRALLLARLEQIAGQQVRLAQAQLTETQARAILAATQQVPSPAASISPTTNPAATSGPQVDAAVAAWERTDKTRRDALDAQVSMLTSLVPDSGREDAPGQTAELAAIEDHWWVQVNNGGTWLDLDPSERSATPGKTFDTPRSTMLAEQLDPELFHQLGIRVVAERWNGNTFSEDVALDYTARSSDLIGQPIVLTFSPVSWLGTQAGQALADQVKAQAMAANQWQPVLRVGDRSISQNGFNDGAAGQVTAVWLDFVLRSPGTAQRVIRREVMDVRGPSARGAAAPLAPTMSDSVKLERGLALLGEVQVMPMVSDMSPQFVLHQTTQAFLGNRDVLLRVASAGQSASAPDLASASNALSSVPSALYALALERRWLSPVSADRYLDRINVLSAFSRPEIEQNVLTSQETLDIANNEIAVSPAAADPNRVRLEQGVADTFAEQAALPDAQTGQNTADLFTAYGAHGERPVAVLRGGNPSSQRLQISPDALARVDDDIAAGYVVVAPTQVVELDGKERFGWWRVDPRSGTSIGVMGSGYHQEATERSLEDTHISGGTRLCAGVIDAASEYGQFLWLMYDELNASLIAAQLAYGPESAEAKQILMQKIDIIEKLQGCAKTPEF
jgi:hypothetical protein